MEYTPVSGSKLEGNTSVLISKSANSELTKVDVEVTIPVSDLGKLVDLFYKDTGATAIMKTGSTEKSVASTKVTVDTAEYIKWTFEGLDVGSSYDLTINILGSTIEGSLGEDLAKTIPITFKAQPHTNS